MRGHQPWNLYNTLFKCPSDGGVAWQVEGSGGVAGALLFPAVLLFFFSRPFCLLHSISCRIMVVVAVVHADNSLCTLFRGGLRESTGGLYSAGVW